MIKSLNHWVGRKDVRLCIDSRFYYGRVEKCFLRGPMTYCSEYVFVGKDGIKVRITNGLVNRVRAASTFGGRYLSLRMVMETFKGNNFEELLAGGSG